jgi:hypothetical protein
MDWELYEYSAIIETDILSFQPNHLWQTLGVLKIVIHTETSSLG